MSIDKMIKKAYDLIQKRKVEHIGEGTYNVVGEHGTYTVAQKIDGEINCNCPGFIRRGRCSHSLAVLMLTKPELLRSVEREIERTSEKQNF
ncbi:MAG: SWIM zinc finger family protein [Candidatus Bathyarchaeia archaeon]